MINKKKLTYNEELSSLKERYENKVIKLGEDQCWSWNGNIHCGYGRISYKGKFIGAHRASYMIHIGEIPEKLHVLHNCPGGDNPLCSNPKHLWIGTHSDNMADMIAKGRNYILKSGVLSPGAKLNEMQVIEIKKLLATGLYLREIAKLFNISKSSVGNIKTGLTWKGVGGEFLDSVIKNRKRGSNRDK